MENCLLRKLKVGVNNNNLPKFKELRLPITSGNGSLRITVGSTSTAVMSGLNGLEFESGGGAFNALNTIAASVSGTLCIPDKDKITSIISYDTLSTTDPNKLAIDDSSVFKYVSSLRELVMKYKAFNVSDLGTISLINIMLYPYDLNSKITGTLSELVSHMPDYFNGSIVMRGDMSEFTGDLSSLSPLTNYRVDFDVSANLSGSLHYLGKKTFFVAFKKNAMSYTGTRPTGSYFISSTGDGIKFATKTDVENFLIDNATFDFSTEATARPTIYNKLYLNCEGIIYDDLSAEAKTAITTIKAKSLGTGHVVVKLNGVEL